jgi:hypothetical protein
MPNAQLKEKTGVSKVPAVPPEDFTNSILSHNLSLTKAAILRQRLHYIVLNTYSVKNVVDSSHRFLLLA